FQMYLKTLSENLPIQKIYAEVADGKGNVGVQDENLTEDLKAIVEQVKSIPTVDVKEILKSLLSTEPYKSNDVAVNYINRELGEL
ncbi:ATP-binding protein, partial [Enterococcus faecalis]